MEVAVNMTQRPCCFTFTKAVRLRWACCASLLPAYVCCHSVLLVKLSA